MAEDLYKILEVERNASEADIKKAYRRLARQYHPDVNKEAGAEDKFKQVQKAYDILSDSQKKAQYDQFGVTDDSPQGGFGGGGGFGFESNFDDIFDAFFGGGGARRGQGRQVRRGEDLRFDLEISLEEAAAGLAKEIEIFHLERCGDCSGSGSKAGTSKTQCSHCQGSGQVKTVQRTMLGSFSQVITCHHCNGTGEIIKDPCKNCAGKGLEKKKKRIRLDIPAGVDKGTRLRVSGEGNFGENGGPAGDLYVFLNVKDHPYLERDGQDVHLDIEVPLTLALLGTELEVPIIGGMAKLNIPAGTQPNAILRLKGKGLPGLRGFSRGDQLVHVKIVMPKLSGKEKDLVEELKKLRQDDKNLGSFEAYTKRR
ncbi:MAG: molecular chaperone DnaJ [Candidatus Margulisiibacteriota bacterium]